MNSKRPFTSCSESPERTSVAKLKAKTVQKRRWKIFEEIEALRSELKDLQLRCDHLGHVHYSPDPSGKNDSSYDCSACGSEWQSWPKDVPRD